MKLPSLNKQQPQPAAAPTEADLKAAMDAVAAELERLKMKRVRLGLADTADIRVPEVLDEVLADQRFSVAAMAYRKYFETAGADDDRGPGAKSDAALDEAEKARTRRLLAQLNIDADKLAQLAPLAS